jgi:carboxylesterase
VTPFVVLAALAALAAATVLWRARRRTMWRAADRSVSARLPLGADGIVRGAEPFFEGGHRRAALLLHGFGDTPQSLAHLARRLADAGWTVSVPLLPGHGRTLDEFSRTGAEDWLAHVRQAFEELSARHFPVVICGQSMGALLAIELAVDHRVSALALLAPYISMPWAVQSVAIVWPAVQGLYSVLRTHDGRSVQDPSAEAQSLAYGYTTPRLVSELRGLMRRARRRLPEIRTATLIVHSREDNRVPAADVRRAAALIAHPIKALQWMTGCGHVLTADYGKDVVADLVIDWFERCTAREGAPTTAR